jgi:hypothetical protein
VEQKKLKSAVVVDFNIALVKKMVFCTLVLRFFHHMDFLINHKDLPNL